MALEGFDHLLETSAIGRGDFHPIAVFEKCALKLGDAFPFITGAETLIVAKRRRLDPKPDAGPRKPLPPEKIATSA